MRKLCLVLTLLLLLFAEAFAATARITWKQTAADLPYVKEWVVYVGDTANPTTELTRIPYDGTGAASYTSTVPITVTGTPGATVRKYISLATVSRNNNVTAKTAGVTALTGGVGYLDFVVPYPDVSAPFEVLIQVVIGP